MLGSMVYVCLPGFPDGSDHNLPAMPETWVQSLGWENPMEEDWATHSSILASRIPMDREPWRGYCLWGHKELDMTE